MSQPVVIENDALRMEVWPHLGGKVSSILDKADRFELLFNYPSEVPAETLYDRPYSSGWYAGWDECFPAVSPCAYVGPPYDKIAVPDHGELWGLPTTSVPAKGGITTVWHGLRFGYRLVRHLYLEGSTLAADYTLINLAPFEFRFVWAQHALMSLVVPVELELVQGAAFRLSHGSEGADVQRAFVWPRVGEGEDLSRPDQLPGRRSWKVFSKEPIGAAAMVRYPTRSRWVKIEYQAEELPAYWGVWLNTGGWAGHRHFAIEPTTGRYDQLDRSIQNHSAGRVAASGRKDWSVRWSVG